MAHRASSGFSFIRPLALVALGLGSTPVARAQEGNPWGKVLAPALSNPDLTRQCQLTAALNPEMTSATKIVAEGGLVAVPPPPLWRVYQDRIRGNQALLEASDTAFQAITESNVGDSARAAGDKTDPASDPADPGQREMWTEAEIRRTAARIAATGGEGFSALQEGVCAAYNAVRMAAPPADGTPSVTVIPPFVSHTEEALFVPSPKGGATGTPVETSADSRGIFDRVRDKVFEIYMKENGRERLAWYAVIFLALYGLIHNFIGFFAWGRMRAASGIQRFRAWRKEEASEKMNKLAQPSKREDPPVPFDDFADWLPGSKAAAVAQERQRPGSKRKVEDAAPPIPFDDFARRPHGFVAVRRDKAVEGEGDQEEPPPIPFDVLSRS